MKVSTTNLHMCTTSFPMNPNSDQPINYPSNLTLNPSRSQSGNTTLPFNSSTKKQIKDTTFQTTQSFTPFSSSKPKNTSNFKSNTSSNMVKNKTSSNMVKTNTSSNMVKTNTSYSMVKTNNQIQNPCIADPRAQEEKINSLIDKRIKESLQDKLMFHANWFDWLTKLFLWKYIPLIWGK